MVKIDRELLQKLRDHTGLGIMDCRKALEEHNGSFDKALEALRKKGAAIAAKRADKETGEGLIKSYIHPGDRIGVLVELNCETDFVANTESVRQFAHDLCLQIAANNPLYLTTDEVDPKLVDSERAIFQEQTAGSNKPEKIVNQIIENKVQRFYSEVCLLEQPFLKDDQRTVKSILQDLIAKTGESIRIKRFCRFELGK